MGDHSKPARSSRRGFFASLMGDKKNSSTAMVKMLTADGKLVEIDKEVLANAAVKKKAGNQEIFEWMNNPSKQTDKNG